MGTFLNSLVPLNSYQTTASGTYFVDKSSLLDELLPAIGTEERFFCITRPRRFGKSVMANMIAAFFGKAADAEKIFKNLKISSSELYKKHLNRHHVIYIDFSEMPRDCANYQNYIDRIQNGINSDLAEGYPDIPIDTAKAVWDILTDIFQKTGDRFVFVMDEWDAVFHMPFIMEKERMDYLLFLKSLDSLKAL